MPTKVKPKQKSAEKYYQAVGRRKTSTCTVRLYEKKDGGILVNEKKLEEYFPTFDLQKKVKDPLKELILLDKFFVSIKVSGGGVKSQAEAVRHGIARAIVSFDENLRKQMKATGFLTRDPRMRESKKPGLKRARRAPQWRKR
jgi:small subunit ribosomal protein S9